MKILSILLLLGACGGGSELVVKEAPLFNPPVGIESKHTVDYYSPEQMKTVLKAEEAFRAAKAASAASAARAASTPSP